MMSASLARDLRALLSGQVLDDEAARLDRSGDFGRMTRRIPGVVVRPAGTGDGQMPAAPASQSGFRPIRRNA